MEEASNINLRKDNKFVNANKTALRRKLCMKTKIKLIWISRAQASKHVRRAG
jgi:hypothetical protein